MIPEPNELRRNQIKAVFRRHHGAAAQVARELELTPQNVYDWLKGVGRSARVEAAIRQRAAELIAAEQQKREVA